LRRNGGIYGFESILRLSVGEHNSAGFALNELKEHLLHFRNTGFFQLAFQISDTGLGSAYIFLAHMFIYIRY
jgi:hypothetical protein